MFSSHLTCKALISCRASKAVLSNVNLRTLSFKSRVSSKITVLSIKNNYKSLNYVKSFCSKVFEERIKEDENQNSKLSFQEMLNFRKKQAQSSILLEIRNKEDIPYAISSCEKFGIIKKAFSYKALSENVFILLEFDNENSVRELLLNSSYKNISDVFPVLSRIIGYNKKLEQKVPKTSIEIEEDLPCISHIKERTVSDLIQNIYLSEQLTELNVRLRFFFCCIVKELLAGPFPFCDAIPFGSSVNGIGRHDCDLDLMIRLYPENSEKMRQSDLYFVNKTCVGDIQNLQKKVVYCTGDLLKIFSPGVVSVQKILHARVPIVKLDHRILGMKVDISVNNMAPILQSELLYFWGEVDARVRPLIHAVKKWAREAGVTYESPGTWITNFSLTLLVIFFLQNRPIPILPAMFNSVNIKGAEFTDEYKLEYLIPLSELKTKASLNNESLAVLLREFFAYIGSHPFENKLISLISGMAVEEKTGSPIWIQYPFEEDLNVSKNVSDHELFDMCEKARVSAKYMDAHINSKTMQLRDLSTVLGIPNIVKLSQNKSKRIDVSSLLGDNSNRKSSRRRAS